MPAPPRTNGQTVAVTEPLPPGLYEVLVTEVLAEQLAQVEDWLVVTAGEVRAAEVADRVALHLGRVVERAIDGAPEDQRVEVAIAVARDLVARLAELVAVRSGDLGVERPVSPGSVLRSITARRPDGTPDVLDEPLIPLLDTTLLTNAPGEPRVGSQVLAEVASADRIDVVMAFIRRSGIRPLLDALRRHVERSGESDLPALRVLTTTYTGSTERRALDELSDLGADVRVSYDTTTTRLHAKAWLFHRRSGHSTAYIGSSNLTHSAQVDGLEWNVRVSAARNAAVVAKVAAVYESYWQSGDFRPFDADEFDRETERAGDSGPTVLLSPIELRPEPFQERLLEQIAVARRHGHHRNLLVSATGTGKTVMAALDYVRLRAELPRARLLFVAHRQEILEQSQATFRYAMREPAFGERWVGGHRPTQFEHVFASIQSLTAAGLDDLAPDHFDVVIVDEFHHAAARSYERLLDHVAPVELLGLTATPERADGLSLLGRFDGRIAAELRLWDAIDQHRLSPFAYFGLNDDDLDFREVLWHRGRGYDVEGLTNVYTANDALARRVVKALIDRAEDPATMRVLGFCVSVDHARFMARVFNEAKIDAVAVWGDSPADERQAALRDLADGRVQVVFSVDLFNEGVDVPVVDTLLLLRPTDSPVLFLQQLGRGLRRAPGKTMCTVLDFVGHHRKEFRFDRRFGALLGGTRKDLERQVRGRFPFLPAGCHMELDEVAAKVVLRSIQQSIPSRWTAKVDELRKFAATGREVTLQSFLDESGYDLGDVYSGNRGWSDLCEDAGVPLNVFGPDEVPLRRAIGRLDHVDDEERLAFYRRWLASASAPDLGALTEREWRLVRMLVASVATQALPKDDTLAKGVDLLWQHPQVRAELGELFDVLSDRVDHVHAPLPSHPDVPLQIHARYTRLEILAAFGVGDATARVTPWQSGVWWAPEAGADLFAFTLDKTSGSFSPTTRHRDYAISRDLIHWESQSATRADSATGRRYQQQAAMGTSVMLFARLRNDDRAFWFLGPATYVSHESEQPMAITWKLDVPLPGDLFASFAAAVA
jgi:superfamily II DNA or RNA helicase/HKD family nuclease